MRSGAAKQVHRLRAGGHRLSRNDVQAIVMAQLLRRLTVVPDLETALTLLDDKRLELDTTVAALVDDAAREE